MIPGHSVAGTLEALWLWLGVLNVLWLRVSVVLWLGALKILWLRLLGILQLGVLKVFGVHPWLIFHITIQSSSCSSSFWQMGQCGPNEHFSVACLGFTMAWGIAEILGGSSVFMGGRCGDWSKGN